MVPASIAAPPNEELVLTLHARGFQVYLCHPDASGQPVWILKAPEALLYDQQGNVVGKHFAGPAWRHHDGSEISGKMAAKADAPDPAAIPWLLVQVTGHSGEGPSAVLLRSSGSIPQVGFRRLPRARNPIVRMVKRDLMVKLNPLLKPNLVLKLSPREKRNPVVKKSSKAATQPIIAFTLPGHEPIFRVFMSF